MYLDVGMRHGVLLVLYILAAVVINAVVIAGNDYLARATDSLLGGGVVEFNRFFLPLVLMIIAGTVMTYIKSICGNNYSTMVQRDIRGKIGAHLLVLPYSYYDEKGTGSIMTKLISDIGEVGRFFSEIMPDLLVDFITVVTVSIYLFKMDAVLTLVLYVTFPVLMVVADHLSRHLTSVVK